MSNRAEQRIHLEIPATYAYIRLIEPCIHSLFSHIEGLAEPKVLAYNTVLAIHEICANIVGHAYELQEPNSLDLAFVFHQQSRQLVVELRDTGNSFDPSTVPMPDLDEGQEHGYGLFLANCLMDEVFYESSGGYNLWRLTKHLS